MNRRRLWLLSCVWLTGCGRYAEFTLPSPSGNTENIRYEWHAKPVPVLGRGPAGAWDAVDVLNPSVVRAGGQYLNYYSGYDGQTWHTGKAVSFNGLSWTKTGKILSPGPAAWEGTYIAANGSALEFRGVLLYYYQAGQPPGIGLMAPEKLNTPVLDVGPYGSWDELGVADPYAFEAEGKLYLYYLGMDRSRRQRLGVAMSNDGRHWTKLRTNPILELGDYDAFDEHGLGEPAVWTAHGWYWMLYTGRSRTEQRRLGLAKSKDGVRWEKIPGAIAGDQAWDREVICDPTVIVEDDRVRVWFGGGDRPSPDQNLDGQIGYGELTVAGR